MEPEEAPRIDWAGDRSLRVQLGESISPETSRRVRAATRALKAAQLPGLVDLIPAYGTVLLAFDLRRIDYDVTEALVEKALEQLDEGPAAEPRLVEVPVCYDPPFAPDLVAVADHCGLPGREVVRLHSSAEYTVEFLGFSPGFPYLSGLPERLATPRLQQPRTRVPAGSVAIGGAHAGIYPQETPGGWRIIGRTPAAVFDASRDPPALCGMGDRVRFIPIGTERFDELSRQASR